MFARLKHKTKRYAKHAHTIKGVRDKRLITTYNRDKD